MVQGKTIVISLGGSTIVPDKVDYNFLKAFKNAIGKVRGKTRIVICTGGGSIAREYISALEKEGINAIDRDWMGIAATRLNAKLVGLFLGRCNSEIPSSLNEVVESAKKHDIVVCGGLVPGRTSDGSTAEIAKELKAEVFINMTNVAGLFDKDPKKYKDAKLIPTISHDEFAKIVRKIEEKPGQHFILDATAAKFSREAGIKVVILQGIENLEKCLEGKKFIGTVIS